MSSENINELVRRAKNGDKEAFGDLYENYSREMYRFALWYLGDRYFAEDAVSEAAINAFVGIKNVRDTEKFKSWLFTILLRSCQKQLKNIVGMRRGVDINMVQKESENISPEESAEIRTALTLLSDEDREILLLSALGNLSSKEIGQIFSMPSGTVRSKLSRSTDKLYSVLNERSVRNGK